MLHHEPDLLAVRDLERVAVGIAEERPVADGGSGVGGARHEPALGPREVLARAETHLPEYVGLMRSKHSSHRATYTGKEGTVVLTAHRHGPYTDVTAETDRLRTSRMDYEIQRFLNTLPYEYGDPSGPLPEDFGQ